MARRHLRHEISEEKSGDLDHGLVACSRFHPVPRATGRSGKVPLYPIIVPLSDVDLSRPRRDEVVMSR
jgi:hypothetical protein